MLDGSANPETAKQTTACSDGKARRLSNLTPFAKGTSGNPRGRAKKDLDLAAMAQKHAELAVLTLAKCLTDDTAAWPSKVSAASELLDRGFGRAPQSLNMTHKVEFTAQLEDFLRALNSNKAQAALEKPTVDAEFEQIILQNDTPSAEPKE